MNYTEVFPFIFINHGKPLDIYSFQGEAYFIFRFKEIVNDSVIKEIEKQTPKILKGNFLWSDKMMMNYAIYEEDEITMNYMKKRKLGYEVEMDEDLQMELFTDFADEIESWANNVNKIVPVDFFIGHPVIQGSKWDSYSSDELPNLVNKLEAESQELNPRKKQIINEALQQLMQSKGKVLNKELSGKIAELLKITA